MARGTTGRRAAVSFGEGDRQVPKKRHEADATGFSRQHIRYPSFARGR